MLATGVCIAQGCSGWARCAWVHWSAPGGRNRVAHGAPPGTRILVEHLLIHMHPHLVAAAQLRPHEQHLGQGRVQRELHHVPTQLRQPAWG